MGLFIGETVDFDLLWRIQRSLLVILDRLLFVLLLFYLIWKKGWLFVLEFKFIGTVTRGEKKFWAFWHAMIEKKKRHVLIKLK